MKKLILIFGLGLSLVGPSQSFAHGKRHRPKDACAGAIEAVTGVVKTSTNIIYACADAHRSGQYQSVAKYSELLQKTYTLMNRALAYCQKQCDAETAAFSCSENDLPTNCY